MNFLKLLRNISMIILLIKSVTSNYDVNLIATAITEVIDDFFIKTSSKFDIILYGEATYHLNDVINQVLPKIDKNVLIEYRHIKDIRKHILTLSHSMVIFTYGQKNVQIFNNQVNVIKSLAKQNRFLFYIENMFDIADSNIRDEIDEQELVDKTDTTFNEFFIFEMEGKICLFKWYYYYNMHVTQIHKVALRLDIFKTHWERKLTTYKQFDLIDPVVFTFCLHYTFYIENFDMHELNLEQLEKFINSGQAKYTGLFFELTQLMSKLGNFTAYYQPYIYTNNLTTVNFFPQNNRVMYFSFDFRLQSIMNRFHQFVAQFTTPFTVVNFNLLITPSEFYTNYEKLFFPFDRATWMLLIITFFAAFTAIFIIDLMSRKIRNLVYGSGIEMPIYNLVGTFFGISQIQLPREAFSRTILILFVWFCLIFRTCYQSMMFEFTTSDMRKPLPETIEDLHERNYTIFVESKLEESRHSKEFVVSKLGSSNVKLDTLDFRAEYKYALENREHVKYAFLINTIDHQLYNQTFKDSLIIMRNFKIPSMLMIAAIQNCIIFHLLDDALNKLLPSGIPKYLLDNGMRAFLTPLDLPDEDSLRVFSLSDLEYGFVLWIAACGVSTVVFVCELHGLFLRRQMRKLIGLVYFGWLLFMRLRIYNG